MLLQPFLLLAMLFTVSVATQLPKNHCSHYFQYVQLSSGNYQGEFTVHLQYGHNRIDVRYSQRSNELKVGSLLPYPNDITVPIHPGEAQFRQDLWPNDDDLLPKLTRLTFNDKTLCSSNDYNPPSSYYNSFYELEINVPQFNSFQWDLERAVTESSFEKVTAAFDYAIEKSYHIVSDLTPEHPVTAAPSLPLWPPGTTIATLTRTSSQNTPTSKNPTVNPVRMNRILNPSLDSPSVVECGQESLFISFIYKGHEYPRGTYPWLTALYHMVSFELKFKCGGSLVSNSLVITAAHCVYMLKEDNVVLGLGRHDLANYNEDGAEMRHVSRILIHPEYSTRVSQQPDADIALITMERPVVFNDVIRPICLWEAAVSEVQHDVGTVAGWGADENGNGLTRYPSDVNATIVTELECAKRIRVKKVLGRSLCAGNLDGSGPCLGDSGSGLMIKHNNRWLLRGVVSLGQRSLVGYCNHTHQYVLYADLSKHMTWINQNIG